MTRSSPVGNGNKTTTPNDIHAVNESDARRIHQFLIERTDEMVDQLSVFARMETPSELPSTQASAFEFLTTHFEKLDFRCKWFLGKSFGGQLLAIPRSIGKGAPKQLLLGHCDTVWPLGTLQQMPVMRRDGRLYGPGVYDMKGGLIQAIYALTAIQQLKISFAVQPIFFINSDEEIGSVESADRIRLLARIVDRAMIMEPSLGPAGALKTSRKGVGRFRITAFGRAAHAGLDPDKGISAILEMSHVIQKLFALNDHSQGVSVNVGQVNGGLRPNVIAPECHAEIDVRVRTRDDATRVKKAIESITETTPGTELRIEGEISRPPLEPTPRNRNLWNHAQTYAQWLGIELVESAAGGGSDGNFTSLFTATLDGLGAVGDGAHATHEHVVIEKMAERAALLACLIAGEPASTR